MNDKVKNILIPFIIMVIVNLGSFYFINNKNFGEGLNPHVGLLFISGLLLGPYGSIGAVFGNIVGDLVHGYNLIEIILYSFTSFTISYIPYKLWYQQLTKKYEITKPKLNSTRNIVLFLVLIIACGILYALFTKKIYYLAYPGNANESFIIGIRYLINFISFSFIFGIIGIWLSKKTNFIHTPKISNKKVNKTFYRVIFLLLTVFSVIILISDLVPKGDFILGFELVLLLVLLFVYFTKPMTSKIISSEENSIPESVMNIFLLATLIIAILGIVISSDALLNSTLASYLPLEFNEISLLSLILTDIILIIFFIPSLGVLRYIEKKVIEPISSFSKIEEHIKEGEEISSDDLISVYSEYTDEDNEIGKLSRSYINLIKYNNNYIKNIRENESEKQRINAELSIAHKIQESNLPKDSLDDDSFIVSGYSKPAKEVGGDFYDYYMLNDEELVVVIGDASGKGVPAALLATITQKLIKQIVLNDSDPSSVLYSLNNQICENNTEMMFITLWLGIYNKNTKRLTYSNAGHNPPIIKVDGVFDYLDLDPGLILGILENNEFVKDSIVLEDELVLYTDGITDAENNNHIMYGEKRLLSFLNNCASEDIIESLIGNIDSFVEGAMQADDMTLLVLKDKK